MKVARVKGLEAEDLDAIRALNEQQLPWWIRYQRNPRPDRVETFTDASGARVKRVIVDEPKILTARFCDADAAVVSLRLIAVKYHILSHNLPTAEVNEEAAA
jgi:hypothetical protein